MEGGRVRILDMSAGNRAVWFNKSHPDCLYLDRRESVNPDIVCDTRKLPAEVGEGYDLIVFDPPHKNCGPNSNMSKTYGHSTTAEILSTIEGSGREAARVSKPSALMALKWNTGLSITTDGSGRSPITGQVGAEKTSWLSS